MLAFEGPARRWEPRTLRFRLYYAAGRIARGSRRLPLRLDSRWPWSPQLTAAFTRLASLPCTRPENTTPDNDSGHQPKITNDRG
jgi:hypothetical protein